MVTYIVTMPSEDDSESRRYKCGLRNTAPSPCRHRRTSPDPGPDPNQISVRGERGPVV